ACKVKFKSCVCSLANLMVRSSLTDAGRITAFHCWAITGKDVEISEPIKPANTIAVRRNLRFVFMVSCDVASMKSTFGAQGTNGFQSREQKVRLLANAASLSQLKLQPPSSEPSSLRIRWTECHFACPSAYIVFIPSKCK